MRSVIVFLLFSAVAAGQKNLTSALGTSVDNGVSILSYTIWWYDVGKVALDGQPGIKAVVKTVRKKPFGEWNVVYFDRDKTTPAKILKRLRAKGCPKAKQVKPVTATANGTTLTLKNPYVAPGDCVLLVMGGKGDVKPNVTVPKGWTLYPGPARLKSRETWMYAQTPKNVKPGAHTITLEVPVAKGAGSAKATLSVHVVSYVK